MKYSILIQFETDRSLTQDEMAALEDTVALQIVEPADLYGQEAEFQTSEIHISIDCEVE